MNEKAPWEGLSDILFIRVLSLCIPILFILKIMLLFSFGGEAYQSLLYLSFHPLAFPGDLIRYCSLSKLSVFWPMLGFLVPLSSLIGDAQTVFVAYVLVAFATLIVVYKIATLLSSKYVSLLFVFFITVGCGLLPSAAMGVIWPHGFYQTAVGSFCGLTVIYFYLSRRYLSCMAMLALGFAIHMKTMFGFACPLGLLILLECFDNSFSDKKLVMKSIALASPFLLVIASVFFVLTQEINSLPELGAATVIRQAGEHDLLILWGSWYDQYFRYVEYVLLQMAGIVLYKRYSPQGRPALRAFQLLILGNVCLVLGMGVSALVKMGLLSPSPWLLFGWAKNAILPCFFAFFFIAHFLARPLPLSTLKNNFAAPFLFVAGTFLLFLTLFGTELFVDGHMRKVVVFIFVLAIAAFSLAKLFTRENLNYAVVGTIIAGLLFYTTYLLISVYRTEMTAHPGSSFFFRSAISAYDDYTAGRWLSQNSAIDDICLNPVVGRQGIEYYQAYRNWSGRPLFYTDEIGEVYGSRDGYLEWRRRKAVLTSWERTGDSAILSAQKIRYVIVRKSDLPALPTRGLTNVFENKTIMILRVPSE